MNKIAQYVHGEKAMQVSNLIQSGSGIQPPPAGTATVNSGTEQTSNTTASAADTLSITSNKIMISQQVVTQQIEIALEIKSPVNYITQGSGSDDHEARLADDVTKKIHDEKASHSDDMSDEDSHLAAVKSVRIKVAQGFESAKISLTQIGIMDKAVESNVEQTRTRIDAVINQAANLPTNEAGSTQTPVNVETTAINTASASRELTSSFQVTTREGDIVTLNFNRSQAITAGSVESSEGSLIYAGSASSTQLEFSVQGELNEHESESIKKVVERISELAKKMFNGKISAAMEKLGEFKMDTKHLAGMSLSMSSSVTYQSMSVYTQVSNIPVESAPTASEISPSNTTAVATPAITPVNNSSQATSSVSSSGQVNVQSVVTEPAAVQVARETSQIVSEAVVSNAFENPYADIRNLFTQIVDMFASEHSNIGDDHKDFVSDLFKELVDKLEDDDDRHNEHDDDRDDDDDFEEGENSLAA